ncbi:hypothetical protein HGM15179_003049 [Zosterops borbonicus]|uniref:Uncharacterized protein n=1 Tax=Zosterops borbonicus TaxID=364589 RepID=A0A8K1GSP8_9PASS|nr:hypothetical protein HGM15179_003049 [Zosterops borbonicus]
MTCAVSGLQQEQRLGDISQICECQGTSPQEVQAATRLPHRQLKGIQAGLVTDWFSKDKSPMNSSIPGGAAEIHLRQPNMGIWQGRTKSNTALVRNSLGMRRIEHGGCTPTRVTGFCKMAPNITHVLMPPVG